MGTFFESYKEYVEKCQNRRVVLFCAGKKCLDIMNDYFRYPYSDIAFICDNDNKKWGNRIYTVDICNPEMLTERPDDYVVLICSYNNYIFKRVEEQLKGMGIKNVYSSAILMFSNQIERYNEDGTMKYHERNTYKVITEHTKDLEKVLSLLEDDKSKQIYRAFIDKVKYNIKDYSDIADDLYEHYFSDDIFKYSNKEVLIDGGAFDGDDTIRFDNILSSLGLTIHKSLCFEPDTGNFGKTYRNLENHFGEKAILDENRQIAESEKFTTFKAGLFNKKCGMGFCEYGAHSSRFTQEDVGASVDAVLVDDIAAEENVTFIKFDLEGADIPALIGSEKTIKRCKPKLALSIYHNIEDLWEIPLLVKKMVPDYKLFVRHHTIHLWDKILYAAIEQDLIKR